MKKFIFSLFVVSCLLVSLPVFSCPDYYLTYDSKIAWFDGDGNFQSTYPTYSYPTYSYSTYSYHYPTYPTYYPYSGHDGYDAFVPNTYYH